VFKRRWNALNSVFCDFYIAHASEALICVLDIPKTIAIWHWIVAAESPAADNLLKAAGCKEGKMADN